MQRLKTEVEAARRSVASLRRPSPSEPGEIAVDCGESQPSNSEGAEPCAQPKEAGPGARWPSEAATAGPNAEGAEPGAQPKEAGPGERWPSTAAGKASRPCRLGQPGPLARTIITLSAKWGVHIYAKYANI